jgi:hypothetical protein
MFVGAAGAETSGRDWEDSEGGDKGTYPSSELRMALALATMLKKSNV